MRALLLILLLAGCGLHAQTIDESRSRFLSSPHGRTGTYAPYRVVVGDLGGADTLTVRSICDGVIMRREVAVAGQDSVEVILPVMVGESARIEAEATQTAALKPDLPQRRIEPDYARPYVAVFSTDPVYARGVLPSSPGSAICDYYDLSEFFTDWRMLDGYDAIVILNPAEVRLPEGSQRAIAEFCSLGGAALVAGSFRFGEQVVDLPPFADPVVQVHRGFSVQRFGYGAGAIYRVSADELRSSTSAQDIIVDALRDHFWFGADKPPAGVPMSRVAPVRAPLATPLPSSNTAPGLLFWALAGGLLLISGLAPVIAARGTKRAWPAQLVLVTCCAAIGFSATLQERPMPVLEVSAIVSTGQGQAESARFFIHAQDPWRESINISLDGTGRRELYRPSPALPGWNAWVVDLPLSEHVADRGEAARASGGIVNGQSFRDFATSAHQGSTSFSTDDAYLLDWWLEANAYRGRAAELSPVEMHPAATLWVDARLVPRGAIRVTPLRVGD